MTAQYKFKYIPFAVVCDRAGVIYLYVIQYLSQYRTEYSTGTV